MKIVCFCLLVAMSFGPKALALDVGLSFEDAPSAPTPLLGVERANRLLAALASARVDQAIFFAVGQNAAINGTKRLKQYANAGHLIGSQGYSLRTVDELGSTAFVQDMKKNDLLLRDLPGFQMWFRFPRLNQGSTAAARDDVRVWIYHMLYGRAQVTINTPDEALDRMVQDGVAAGRRVNVEHLRRLYISVMMECITHYDQMARTVVGSSPKHLVRLHENDLAALFAGDLVEALRQGGARIIPATEALNDDFNRYESDVVPINGSQILAIAEEKSIPDAYPAMIEDTARLERAFADANVWETAP